MSSGVGKRLKAVRVREGLTQAEMADLTDIPKITLQNYERGTRGITEANLLKITNHPRFKKYVLYLVCDDEAEIGQERPLDKLMEKLLSMTDEEVGQVVEYVEFLGTKRKS